MIPNRIAVVTGSRAEYGLLKPLISLIDADPTLELILIVTGMHTSLLFGSTYHVIERDGFTITHLIPMDLSSDTDQQIGMESGRELTALSRVLTRDRPDLMVILGDRYEILMAANAALLHRIPLAHLCGGDVTQHSIDNSIRNAISQMAHLHFTSDSRASNQLINMGISAGRIVCAGNPGLEELINFTPITRADLIQQLNLQFNTHNLLIIYHPVTLKSDYQQDHDLNLLIQALTELITSSQGFHLFWISPNSDHHRGTIQTAIDQLIDLYPDQIQNFNNLSRHQYLSLAYHGSAVVGNSSSGVYEMPLIKVPVVNFGTRQSGRPLSSGILNLETPQNPNQIIDTIQQAITMDRDSIQPHYRSHGGSKRILRRIKNELNHSGFPHSLLV